MTKIIDARLRFKLRAAKVAMDKKTKLRSRPVAQRLREGLGVYALYGKDRLAAWLEENTWASERVYIYQQLKILIKEMEDETD